MELQIFQILSSQNGEWEGTISDLPRALGLSGSNPDLLLMQERLLHLEERGFILLRKWSGDSKVSRAEWRDDGKFFYTDSFFVSLTPSGRPHFEELESREQDEQRDETGDDLDEKPIVFISCGQASTEEVKLGQDMARAVDEETECKGYFAQSQTSFQALSEHVLGALSRCVAVVAVMHQRGSVRTPHGEHIRGSVWIEQEIAIAAYRVRSSGQDLPVLLYVQTGVCREGLRDLLILNALPFQTEAEVLSNFRSQLSTGQFPGVSVKGSRIRIELGCDRLNTTESYHRYRFKVVITNVESDRIDDYWVELLFPSAVIDTSLPRTSAPSE